MLTCKVHDSLKIMSHSTGIPTINRLKATKRRIRDVSHVTDRKVFGLGILSGIFVSLVTALFRHWGLSDLNLESLIGSSYTAKINSQSWWLGLILHLIFSGFFAFVYSFVFRSARRTGAGVGLHLSLFHWAAGSVALGLVAMIHPLSGEIQPVPGFFFANTNLSTSLTFFLIHLLYGACFGTLFDWAACVNRYPQPLTA
jgi:hypothetical protein